MVRIGVWSAISNFPKDYHTVIVLMCLYIHQKMIISILDLSSYLLEMLLVLHVHYSVKSTASILVDIGK